MDEAMVKKFMEVAPIKSGVPRMMFALEKYVKSPLWAQTLFEMAEKEAESGNAMLFTLIVERLIKEMDEHTDQARKVLKEYGLPRPHPHGLPRPHP